MYPPDALRTETGLTRHVKVMPYGISASQRTAIAGILTVCLAVVSGAAIAPTRNAARKDVSDARGARGVTGAAALVAAQAEGAAMLQAVPLPLRITGQNSLLPTQMAYLGETGSELHFNDDTLLLNPDGGSGSDDVGDALSSTPAMSGQYGAFGVSGKQRGSNGTVRAGGIAGVDNSSAGAWIGAASGVAGLGTISAGRSTQAAPKTDDTRNSSCNAGAACEGTNLVAEKSPLAAVGLDNAPRPLVVTPPPMRPVSAPPVALLTIDQLLPTIKALPVIVTSSAEPSAVNIPEPASLALLSTGTALLWFFLRRRQKRVG